LGTSLPPIEKVIRRLPSAVTGFGVERPLVKRSARRAWSLVLETTKWVGLILLLGYFWFHPPHVDFLWVAPYLGVVSGWLCLESRCCFF